MFLVDDRPISACPASRRLLRDVPDALDGIETWDPGRRRGAEPRSQRHDDLEELGFQRRPPDEQGHDLRSGVEGRFVDADWVRPVTRNEVHDVHEVPFSKMLQPRLGVTWAYNGQDTFYASYARFYPGMNSLPRAASWDRSIQNAFVDVFFDSTGTSYGYRFVESSSGKLFVDDMTPRTTDEFLVGTAKQFKPGLSGRAYFRYRENNHFWEDTNNTARVAFAPPARSSRRRLYIPDLSARLAQIGSGSTYVIAELDGAYTKFYEVTLEAQWRNSKAFVSGSYSHNHYWGNFDQDNTTTANDANIFIGSSIIGDGAGRQLWNFKDGTLRGDRPHLLKVYGYYAVPWQASIGAYFVAQSGQPWEKWSYEPYIALTTSTSDATRYAEAAGSRRSPSHYQARPQLHAELPRREVDEPPGRRGPLQRLQQADRVQLSIRPATAPRSARRGRTTIRGVCRWRVRVRF